MTPAESVTRLYELYGRTVMFLKEDGWQPVPADANVLGVTPDECVLDDGSKGVNYSDELRGPGHSDARAAAEKVARYWHSIGLTTQVTQSSNPKNQTVTATGNDARMNGQYMVDGDGAAISIVTTCVSGDAIELSQQVMRHREEQSSHPTPPSG